MKIYFEVEIGDNAVIQDYMVEKSIKFYYGFDDFSVREVPDREEQGKLLEEALNHLRAHHVQINTMGMLTMGKDNYFAAREFLTRYEAAKNGNS